MTLCLSTWPCILTLMWVGSTSGPEIACSNWIASSNLNYRMTQAQSQTAGIAYHL